MCFLMEHAFLANELNTTNVRYDTNRFSSSDTVAYNGYHFLDTIFGTANGTWSDTDNGK